LYEEGNPVGVKKILEIKGIMGSEVRMPLIKASEQLGDKLAKLIIQENLNN
jgi:4-hydroxy-tetrahydrodipicolinate synthase